MKRLAILGSTGSVGQNALRLVEEYPQRFQVISLVARANVGAILEQARRFRPRVIALEEGAAAREARACAGPVRVLQGPEGVVEAACLSEVDLVLAAISGSAGLRSTYQAVLAGKDVALANKESLVMAGELIMAAVARRGTRLLPVDSEHSAIHQCLRGSPREEVKRLLLTASGGPFLHREAEELERVSVEEALRHPTWQMGPKITIDSATLMNKGLEVIEAHHLFQMPAERISVLIHPQSIVHSLVEFVDGSVLAQLGVTDMRSAILYALSYPDRWASSLPGLDLASVGPLQFFPPDHSKFPCLRLAYQALEGGGTYPVALNAANEVAVESFLSGRIRFPAIPQVIEGVLEGHRSGPAGDLEGVLEADREARERALSLIGQQVV